MSKSTKTTATTTAAVTAPVDVVIAPAPVATLAAAPLVSTVTLALAPPPVPKTAGRKKGVLSGPSFVNVKLSELGRVVSADGIVKVSRTWLKENGIVVTGSETSATATVEGAPADEEGAPAKPAFAVQ